MKTEKETREEKVNSTVVFSIKEVKKCFSPENLQWLPAEQNWIKGSHVSELEGK